MKSPACTWICYGTGLPGSTCPATGTTQASAQRHANDRGHVTSTHDRRDAK